MRSKIAPQSFLPADTTTKKTLIDTTVNGSKIVSLIATSTDSATRAIQLWFTRLAVSYLIGSVDLPALSGTDGSTPSVNLLNPTIIPGLPIDNNGQPYLTIDRGDTLDASMGSTITTAKKVDVTSLYWI